MLKKPKTDNLASEWIGLIGTVTGTGSNCPSLPWMIQFPPLCCHLLPCIELRFQGLRQVVSLGQPAFGLHPESLLVVDLHREVRDLHMGLRGFLLGLLERFLQRA